MAESDDKAAPSAEMAEAKLADAAPGEASELLSAVIHSRQTVLPRRLAEPAPDAQQLAAILASAAAAPDHGQLTPWRFVIVPSGARGRLADAFAAALIERDCQASAEQVAQAREKAFRAPLLMLAIGRLTDDDTDIEPTERLISAGCAIQNMLLMAHSMGFAAALTSGKALKSMALRTLFTLAPAEQALCFINIGTPQRRKPARQRPGVQRYVTLMPEG